ncbi:MAG: FtsW/RodA/SpoVE family cell cycle protein [Peptococcaceae bacterium]|nr:MAG: FtsW/RodA/SpoVE family cell cycle protein [Peptococcaceae bacterium]
MVSLLRQRERYLLLIAGGYLLIGTVIVYPDLSAVNGLIALLAGIAVLVAFLLVSVSWQASCYHGDPFLLPVTAILVATGLVFLFRLDPAAGVRQLVWLAAGLTALVLTTRLLADMRFLSDYKYIYALAGAVALILPIFFGIERGGSRSWLDFGVFQLQPSEFVKILVILFLAGFLAENRAVLAVGSRSVGFLVLPGPQEWGPLLVMWGVSLILLVFQNDLGTALIYYGAFLAMIYVATARVFYVLSGAVLFLGGAVASYFLFEHVQMRIEVWLNPWRFIDAAGYQATQSLFALGSGGMVGSGLGRGYPGFIPAVHTDFIFAAIGEEMGLLGGIGIILLFLSLVFLGIKIALKARDDFAALLATGLTSLLGLQAFVIIGGVTGLLPLTGVTLPFISYGGSSLVANFILLGLLLNVSHEAGKRT